VNFWFWIICVCLFLYCFHFIQCFSWNTLHLGNFICFKLSSYVFFPLLVLVKCVLKALVGFSLIM
jgi:hypothetical protein